MLYSADSSIVCLVSRARVRLLHLVQLLLFVGPQNYCLYFIIYLKHIYMFAPICIFISGLCGGGTQRFIFALGLEMF